VSIALRRKRPWLRRRVLPFDLGATPTPDGATRFRVWAPRARTIELEVLAPALRCALRRDAHDVFEVLADGVGPGAEYCFLLDGERRRPDPCSREQPRGVHGPSRVVDTRAFRWSDASYRCPALEQFVFYELHVGTFTAEGTFDAARARLPELRELGVTAIELMPIAEFPGTRNWGYDGVHLFAPQSSYGGAGGLQRFIDACHHHGLACVLDVVYNHVGPEGNYLREFAPYFTRRYGSAWGEAINFDGPDSDEVRRFFIGNALYWLREYHVDALRLDAIHAIYDFSAEHLLSEMQSAVQAQAQLLGRPAYLIAESDLNDVRVIAPRAAGGYALDAQWNDDFHHALRALLTETQRGYFGDFGRVADLAQAIAEGYVYDGRYSAFRRRRHGNSARGQPGQRFVVFAQNHDQVANASGGQRLSALIDLERQKLAASVLLCAPALPLLFMGEEFGARTRFDYFVSHSDPDLIEAVRKGRSAEHEGFNDDAFRDPQAESTFAGSSLDWASRAQLPHAQLRALHRDLLALRRAHASLNDCDRRRLRVAFSETPRWLRLERRAASGEAALCIFNFSADTLAATIEAAPGRYRLALATCDARYGGEAASSVRVAEQLELRADACATATCPAWSALVYLKPAAGE
jgi:maltooligosyltrehalose trehalohydrolase